MQSPRDHAIDVLIEDVFHVKKGTLDYYLVKSGLLKGKGVEEFRQEFKEFLSHTNLSREEVSKQVMESGAGRGFYLAYGISILDFDTPLPKN
jgi:hypothetical protein